jgi:hypothetical protein
VGLEVVDVQQTVESVAAEIDDQHGRRAATEG